jgi:hypothetical protein
MIEAVVRHFRCENGVIEEVFDSLKLNWTEVPAKRAPTTSVAIMTGFHYKETDGLTF